MVCSAQIPSETDTTSTPVPDVGHNFIQSPIETVNPANGSVSIRIGIPIPPSRGFTLPFGFAYDSSGVFYIGCGGGPLCRNSLIWDTTRAVLSEGGWSYSAPQLSVQRSAFTAVNDIGNPVTCYDLNNFVMQDAQGDRRNLGLTYFSTNQYCELAGEEGPVTTSQEGSLLAQTPGGIWTNGVKAVTVTDGDGTVYQFQGGSMSPQLGGCNGTCTPTTFLPTTITDRNNNQTQVYSYRGVGGPILTLTDSIGRTSLNIPTFGASQDSLTVSGISNPYKVNWTTVQANFSVNLYHIGGDTCAGTGSPGSQPSITAISSIVLPNGEQYTFSYDPAYGLISKLTYPTGGYVRYVWGVNVESEYGSWPTVHSDGTTGACDYHFDTPALAYRYVSFDGVHEVLPAGFLVYYKFWNFGLPELRVVKQNHYGDYS